jgi:hypothetical protein
MFCIRADRLGSLCARQSCDRGSPLARRVRVLVTFEASYRAYRLLRARSCGEYMTRYHHTAGSPRPAFSMKGRRIIGDPSQVLDVMRDVLWEHMKQGLDDFVVESAVYIGKLSGRLLSERDLIDGGDFIGGLRLTMKSGAEYDLKLKSSK